MSELNNYEYIINLKEDYCQAKRIYENLQNQIKEVKDGTLEIDCTIEELKSFAESMDKHIKGLEKIAKAENIEL